MSENNESNLEISNELKDFFKDVELTAPMKNALIGWTTKTLLNLRTLEEFDLYFCQDISHPLLHEEVDIIRATINKHKDQLILQANENDLINAANDYRITVESIRNFEQFISYFSKDVRLLEREFHKYERNIENRGHEEIFKHIEENLLPKGYSIQMEAEFLRVKVPAYANYVLFGRVDGVVCLAGYQPSPTTSLVSFEIIKRNMDEPKSVVQLIGMIIRGQRPVLHILTDMNSFTFFFCQLDDGGNTVLKYTTDSYCECKTIIENWIGYTNDLLNYSQENRFHIKRIYYEVEISLQWHKPRYVAFSPIEKKTKTLCYYGLNKSELTKLNELEQSFLTSESSKTLKLVSETNRSGPVYKLEHENKLLVVKLSHVYSTDVYGNLIIYELMNEEYIYKKLGKVSDGPWPKLFYSGYIFDMNYYAIVTEFVEGRRPNREDEDDFKGCFESLKKLHELGFMHGDARPPNFIIDRQKACILDFGFSFRVGTLEIDEEVERDVKKMKSNVGFNIKD